MAIQTTSTNESINTRTTALTPLNLYLERVRAISDKIRCENLGYNYTPFQVGGLIGQQQALRLNVAVSIVDFKVSGNI